MSVRYFPGCPNWRESGERMRPDAADLAASLQEENVT